MFVGSFHTRHRFDSKVVVQVAAGKAALQKTLEEEAAKADHVETTHQTYHSLHLTPYTLHPTPHSLHPTRTLHPTP